MSAVPDLEILSDSIFRLIIGREYHFSRDGERQDITLTRRLCDPAMLLPVLVRMADLMWRAQTEMDWFGLDLVATQDALFGYGLRGVNGSSLALIIAGVDEILHRVVDEDVIEMAELDALADQLASSEHPQRTATH